MSFYQSKQHLSKLAWLDAYEATKPEQDEIIRQLEAGEITVAEAANNIRKLGLWRTRPVTDPILRQMHPNLREIYDPLTGYKITDFDTSMAPGKEPNPEDPPYRERPPGGPPWPGYPKPMPPGGPPPKLANMPPDINTPYLPGGQRTDGIPNIDNPKLQNRLKKRKGIKGPTGATLPPINLAQRDPLDDIRNDMDPDYLRNLEKTSPDIFKDPSKGGSEWKPKPGTDPLTGMPLDLASHDNRQFKSVPATGPRGDQPAGEDLKRYLKDENLLQTQDRLKRA